MDKKLMEQVVKIAIGPEAASRGFLTLYRRNSIYYAQGKVDGFPQGISTKQTDLDEAIRVCIRKTILLQNGQSILDEERPPETFAELAAEYVKTCSQNEAKNVKRLLDFIRPQARPSEINQLTASNICKKRWPAGCQAATQKRMVFAPLNAINNFGSQRGWCPRRTLISPSVIRRPIKFLLPDEFAALHSRATGDLADLLIFLVCIGCRPAELLQFERSKWGYECVSLLDRKTSSDEERDHLIQTYPAVEAVLKRRCNGNWPAANGRVFSTIDGERLPTNVQAAERKLNIVLKKLGEEAGLRRKVTLKIFRATWATWHFAVFRDIVLLQSVGGWASIEVVKKHYAGKAPLAIVPDVCRIWGIDEANLDPWKELVRGLQSPHLW